MEILEKNLNEYEKEHKKVSYKNLLKWLGIYDNMVLCNEIVKFHELELQYGSDYNKETEEYEEIYQYFICDISNWALRKIEEEFSDELIIYWCEDLQVYVLGVDHLGTSWDYVLTGVKAEII